MPQIRWVLYSGVLFERGVGSRGISKVAVWIRATRNPRLIALSITPFSLESNIHGSSLSQGQANVMRVLRVLVSVAHLLIGLVTVALLCSDH